MYWVVPKKIRTPPTEKISAVRRGGGRDCLKNVLNFYRMSGEGGYCQFPPWGGGGVWIFSGTTHYKNSTFGPSVAATASAKTSTPFNIADLPSRPNFSSLALQLLEVLRQAANCGLSTRLVM